MKSITNSARVTDALLISTKEKLPDNPREVTYDHLRWMLGYIMEEYITGEKAQRWLGYVQGAMVANKCCTVESLKRINK